MIILGRIHRSEILHIGVDPHKCLVHNGNHISIPSSNTIANNAEQTNTQPQIAFRTQYVHLQTLQKQLRSTQVVLLLQIQRRQQVYRYGALLVELDALQEGGCLQFDVAC